MNPIPFLANLLIDLFGLATDASKGITAMLVAMLILVTLMGICGFVVKFADKLGLIE